MKSWAEVRSEALAHLSKEQRWRVERRRAERILKYSEDEPRDEHGRWTGDGDGGSADSKPIAGFEAGVHAQGNKDATAKKQEWAKNSPFAGQDINKAVAGSITAQNHLGKVGESIAKKLGVEFVNPGPKVNPQSKKYADQIARVKEKMAARGNDVARVADLARGTFIIDKPEQAGQIVKELAKQYGVAEEGLESPRRQQLC